MPCDAGWKAPKRARFSNSGSQLDSTRRRRIVSAQIRITPARFWHLFASREGGHDKVCSTPRNWAACLLSWVWNCTSAGLATSWQGPARRKIEGWRGTHRGRSKGAPHGFPRWRVPRARRPERYLPQGFFLGSNRIARTSGIQDRRNPEGNTNQRGKHSRHSSAVTPADQFLRRSWKCPPRRRARVSHGLEWPAR